MLATSAVLDALTFHALTFHALTFHALTFHALTFHHPMPFLLLFFGALASAFAGWRLWRRLRFFLHLFQLEGYKEPEYRGWLRKNLQRVGLRRSHQVGAGVLGVGAVLGRVASPALAALVALPGWCAAFASSKLYRSARPKKPLAFTARMKRLLGTAATLALAPVAAGAVGVVRRGARGVPGYLLGWLAADLLAPLWVILAGRINRPVEDRIQEGFKEQARAKLATRPNLTIVGITGSYGKTSTKFIVAEILRQRFHVLASPGSYNTPMGVCLVVNEKMRAEHQALVLEYGIRYAGDIAELAAIAQPDVAVITSVGVAHLETMGSIDAIAEEKGSLIPNSRPGAPVVLNADDPRVAAMDALATGRVWRVSAQGKEDADIVARDIRYGPDGATFTVRDETGAEAPVRTQLLGKHNVLNLLLGVAVGREMGLRLRQIARAIERIEPVEHRLQLKREGDLVVIDDAFNANPVGARNAVEILGQMEAPRRAIVTPGMVELGPRQAEENRAFGRHIAEHLTGDGDLAILVGERQTAPIQEGLRAAGFSDERLRVVGSLFEARDLLRAELRPGDVVLYENDLPDQYDE